MQGPIPSKLACCSPGVATSGHMRMEMLAYRAGVKFLHVPYRGGADALIDLLAGTVHFMNDPTDQSIRQGRQAQHAVRQSQHPQPRIP